MFPDTDTRVYISIHAPRMGSDDFSRDIVNTPYQFQSTLPGWGATLQYGADPKRSANFNPRSPDGERREVAVEYSLRDEFQSTLPGWGATAKMDIFAHDMGKIIHFQH